VKVTLIGNAHGVQLVLSVPLKTAAQLFSSFKILVFPMRLYPDTFLKYQLDYHYFGLTVDQRDFTLLTEADLQKCTTSSVTICPAKVPLYPSQVFTCEGSLFFRVRIDINCVVRTYYVTTRLQLLDTTGRSGRTTSRNHARSPYVAPRRMDGPHAPCCSLEADSYTLRPPVTSPLRRYGRYQS